MKLNTPSQRLDFARMGLWAPEALRSDLLSGVAIAIRLSFRVSLQGRHTTPLSVSYGF